MCRSVTVSNPCAVQHSPSAWANFAPKLTTAITVTGTKNPVIAHVAFLRRVVIDPLERGEATKQHDHGVHILADVLVTCSAQPQSPLTAWLGRSIVFSLGTWPSESTDSELLSTKAERFPSAAPC